MAIEAKTMNSKIGIAETLRKACFAPAFSAASTTSLRGLFHFLKLVGVELVAGDDDLVANVGRKGIQGAARRRCCP